MLYRRPAGNFRDAPAFLGMDQLLDRFDVFVSDSSQIAAVNSNPVAQDRVKVSRIQRSEVFKIKIAGRRVVAGIRIGDIRLSARR